MIHVVRLSAVQIAFLPTDQRHPQASTIVPRYFATGHDWDGGITALDQRLRALLVWSTHSGGSSLVSFRRRACSYPVSIRNRNSRHSSRLSSWRSVLPISSR